MSSFDIIICIGLSRCHLHFGHNAEAIADARQAVNLQPSSMLAKETLGKALYSAGQFENALVEFHKVYRERPSTLYEEWIARCEETIKAFLLGTKIDSMTVQKMLEDKEHCNLDKKSNESLHENKTEIKSSGTNDRREHKKTGLLMGRLHEDMMFLEKIVNHPSLQKNMLVLDEGKNKKDVDSVLKNIRGAALDGLGFLQVRKSFWETSQPPVVKSGKKGCLRKPK